MLKPWLTKGIMTSVKKRISSIENSSELDVMKKKQSYTVNLKHTGILYTNSLKLAKEIIIKNVFMNAKKICLTLGMESSLL